MVSTDVIAGRLFLLNTNMSPDFLQLDDFSTRSLARDSLVAAVSHTPCVEKSPLKRAVS